MDWVIGLSMELQMLLAACFGMLMGAFFCWFGEILTPDDII